MDSKTIWFIRIVGISLIPIGIVISILAYFISSLPIMLAVCLPIPLYAGAGLILSTLPSMGK